jgi:hypothetical protein
LMHPPLMRPSRRWPWWRLGCAETFAILIGCARSTWLR